MRFEKARGDWAEAAPISIATSASPCGSGVPVTTAMCVTKRGPAAVAEDVRMMVPVFHDRASGKSKVWAILGWATEYLGVSFKTPPTAQLLKGRADVRFRGTGYELAVPIFAEAYVTRLLNRDEFRAHCDRYQTRSQVLQHL